MNPTPKIARSNLAIRITRQTTRPGIESDISVNNGRLIRKNMAARLIEHDPSALEELYDRMAGRAFGLAYRIMRNGPNAEDVVQDVFIWIWDNPQKLDPGRESVDGLLLTLVHRRAIDAVRVASRREALPISPAIPGISTLHDDTMGLVEEVHQKLNADAVKAAVHQLSPNHLEVIELAYFGGMTHAEIAEQTKLPLGTVKSRLRLALNGLRKSFGLGGSS